MNDVQQKIQEYRELWKAQPDKRKEIEQMVKNLKCCYPECTAYVASLHRVTCDIHGGIAATYEKRKPLTVLEMQKTLLEWRKG